MKNARVLILAGLLGAGVLMAVPVSNRVDSANRPVVITNQTTSTPYLGSIDAKLNQLLQSRGGRYVFLVSEGELLRLDTQEGKVAMFNIVSGASWDTLAIPERSIGPGNAFYEKYVQFLDKTDFNTN